MSSNHRQDFHRGAGLNPALFLVLAVLLLVGVVYAGALATATNYRVNQMEAKHLCDCGLTCGCCKGCCGSPKGEK